MGSYCLISAEFQFGEINFWSWMVKMVANNKNILKATEVK